MNEKERELVVIAKIQEVRPIEGKDRIELATVENYNVIVGKGEYKVGDLCVYVFYDVILPQKPEFEFLRSRCWSPLYQGFRIREMKMAGEFSSGIVFPLSILPTSLPIREGLELTDLIGAKKYDPEALKERNALANKKDNSGPVLKFLLRFKLFRFLFFRHKKAPVGYPDRVSKSSEINIQKNFGSLKNSGHTFIKTEKLEGQSSCYCLIPKGRFSKKVKYQFYSHNAIRYPNDGSNWDLVSKQFNMESKLRRLKEYYGINFAIEGEIVGPGIQSNIYKFDKINYFVFRMFDVDTGRILPQAEMENVCQKVDLVCVPVLDWTFRLGNKLTVASIVKSSDGISALADVKREGFIITSVKDPTLRAKVKSEAYKIWFEKKNPVNE